MKKRGPYGRILLIGAILLMLSSIIPGMRWWARHEKGKRFVSIGGDGFELRGEPFFPLAVNYIVAKRLVGDSLWIGTCVDYQDSMHLTLSRAKDHEDLRAHMELVRELGFNTVRLVGCGNAIERNGRPWHSFYLYNLRDSLFAIDSADMRARYLDAFADMLAIVREAGLKAIIHVGIRPGEPTTEENFTQVADRFTEDTTILAYDLYNEPLYFDPVWRTKTEVRAIGDHWRAVMREHAPWQLWTIGLANLREFLEWDPAVIDADFISFHPYEHEPGQVMSELYYYGRHCSKPWIVGETAIPADNDSVPWVEQADFARRTLRQAVACGARGYSWWQFRDVDWHRFDPNFMGVVARDGHIRTRSGRMVNGTVKPVADVFREFDPQAPTAEGEQPANYYNWSGGDAYRLTGRVVDVSGEPLTDGVILAWTPDWKRSRNTVTREDGTFELVTDLPLGHWTVSAPNHTRSEGEVDKLLRDTKHGGLVQDIGTITLELPEP